jgi:hypothetical protein
MAEYDDGQTAESYIRTSFRGISVLDVSVFGNREEALRCVDQYSSEFIERFAALHNEGDIEGANVLYSEWRCIMKKLMREQREVDQDAADYILKVYRGTRKILMNLRAAPSHHTHDFSYRGELPRRRRIDHEFG